MLHVPSIPHHRHRCSFTTWIEQIFVFISFAAMYKCVCAISSIFANAENDIWPACEIGIQIYIYIYIEKKEKTKNRRKKRKFTIFGIFPCCSIIFLKSTNLEHNTKAYTFKIYFILLLVFSRCHFCVVLLNFFFWQKYQIFYRMVKRTVCDDDEMNREMRVTEIDEQ